MRPYHIWAWIRDHLSLVGVALFAVATWLVLANRKGVKNMVRSEREVVKAKAEARSLDVELGSERAAELIKEKYREHVKLLDEKQLQRARELEKNPEAMVESILRSASVLLVVLLRTLLAVLVLSTVTPAFAADEFVVVPLEGGLHKTCLKSDPDQCSMVLPQDKPAPFTGVLSTLKLSAHVTAKQETDKERCQEDSDKRWALEHNDRVTDSAISKVQLDEKDSEIKVLERSQSFWTSPYIVVPATVGVTLLLTYLSVKEVQALRN